MGFGKKSSGKAAASSSSSAPLLPDAPIVLVILQEWDSYDFGNSVDAFADWMNARWKKSGYSLSADIIHEVLKCNGRTAFRGIGDHLDGSFQR